MPQRPSTHRPAGLNAPAHLRRGTSTQRGYGADWRRRKAAFLARHKKCVACGGPSNTCDHIIPLTRGGKDDASNWQAMCTACHSRKTVLHDGGFGRPRTRRVEANASGSRSREGNG